MRRARALVKRSKSGKRWVKKWAQTNDTYRQQTTHMQVKNHEVTVPDDKTKTCRSPRNASTQWCWPCAWRARRSTQKRTLLQRKRTKQQAKKEVSRRLRAPLRVSTDNNDKQVPHVYCSIKIKMTRQTRPRKDVRARNSLVPQEDRVNTVEGQVNIEARRACHGDDGKMCRRIRDTDIEGSR